MASRDPESKRQKILQAALSEFAERGVAGARIERLANRAGVSAGLVYSFYAGKDELYEAVYDRIVELAVTELPIDADDLPEYAGRMYDAGLENPEVGRFILWYRLERGDAAARASVTEAMKHKAAAIRSAQRAGTVRADLTSGQILALVQWIAQLWSSHDGSLLNLVPESKRRSTIVRAVRDLVTP